MKQFDCKILSGLQKLRKAEWWKVIRIVLFFITMGITQSFALSKYANATRLSLNVGDRQITLSNSEAIINFSQVIQQQQTISGKVTNASGQPLPGVTVVLKGTTQGTVTNTDGVYSLTNIPEDATLVFSFMIIRSSS